MYFFRAIVCSGLIIYCCLAAGWAWAGPAGVEIRVYCDSRTMEVISEGRVLHLFSVQLGEKGCDKAQEGDKKTPIGTYRITWLVSQGKVCGQGQATIKGATWCREQDSALVLGGPVPTNQTCTEELWRPGYGRHGVVIGLDYPNGEDKAGGKTGSCIQIHGSTRKAMKSGSAGCIKLLDQDALTLCQIINPAETLVTITSSRQMKNDLK
ncbi:MAG: L,D-transpeptidase family protein [Deltaproteobacteria bacterium]|nr:L,D-transpeptidase family protein [Deltaproteobacteria bacterium]